MHCSSTHLRRPIRSLILSCITLILAGCPDKESTEQTELPAIPFADQQLVLFLPDTLDEPERRNLIFDEWSAQSGATCEVQIYPEADGFETLREQLEGNQDDPALVIYPRIWFADINQAELLARVPESMLGPTELNWQDLDAGLVKGTLLWNAQPVAVPIQEPFLLLYYRADLLEEAGLAPPQSWQEYDQLLSNRDEWAGEKTFVEPWSDSFRAITFLSRAICTEKSQGTYSVFLDYNTGEPRISSAGFLRSLKAAQQNLPLLDSRCKGLDPNQCLKLLLSGEAAMAIGPAFFDRTLLEKIEQTEGRIGVLPLPGAATVYDRGRDQWQAPLEGDVNRVTLTGWSGYQAGVLKAGKTDQNRAAWNLLRTLIVDSGRIAFSPGTVTSTRLSTSNEPWIPNVDGLSAQGHNRAVRDSLREHDVVPLLSLVDRDLFLESLTAAVTSAIESQDSPADALSKVNADWIKLMQGEAGEARKQSYARGLGMRLRN